MKLFMQFLQHPVTSSPLGQNILSFLFSKTHCVCSSLYGRQVLHPYNTTGRIIVLCIGTCTFLDSRQEGVVLNRPEIDTLH
jgi:hypothetical protein